VLIICQDTIRNASILETRAIPRKVLGRVQVIPRAASIGQWARLLLEMQLLRYLAALLPFVILTFTSRNAALGVTQAPLAMVVVIAFVELRVLRLTDRQRLRLMDEDEAARRRDTLNFHGRAVLRKIAARRGIADADLALVIEQSELARVAPLTLVSVQSATPAPHVLNLDEGDRALLQTELFAEGFTERDLLALNQFEQVHIRDIRQEAKAVSAHARLSAALQKRKATAQ